VPWFGHELWSLQKDGNLRKYYFVLNGLQHILC
jgi:hypothetical protein